MSQLSEEIISRVDIVDVVGRYVQLKRVGRNFVGLSPFRNERTPSFTVSPEKQIFKCFSTGIGGNAIKFLMEIEKMDYGDAIKQLAEQYHIDISKYQSQSYNPSQYQHTKDDREKMKLMNSLVSGFFADALKKNSESLHYLKDVRNLDDVLIQEFGLGYAPDSLYELSTFLTKKGFSTQDGIEAGLLKKSSQGEVYGFFRNRITFPVKDHMGNIVGFGARALKSEDNPKYLNSSDTLLYEKSKILYGLDRAKKILKEHDFLIVVEGYMDVIALSKAGFGNGVATCGTALTPDHIKMMKRYTNNLYFLFDNDKAGFDATVRALMLCFQYDIYPKILQLPVEYKDIDEYVQSGTFVRSDFLSTQQDAFQCLCQKLLQQYDVQSAVDKQIVINKLFEIVVHVSNRIIRDHYLQYVADNIGVYYEILFQQFNVFSNNQSKFLRKPSSTQEESSQIPKSHLIQSLFFNDMIKEYVPSYYQSFMSIYEFLTFLYKQLGIEEQLTDELLLVGQLWWDQELAGCTQEDQKYLLIHRMFLEYLNSELKKLHKYPHISSEQKQQLLTYKNELMRAVKK